MNAPLAGKVAVVTGGSRGIGRGIARGLGEAGATVYVTGRSTGDGELTIDTSARLVTEAGGEGRAIQVDHFDDDSVGAAFARVADEAGRLDLLVNNVYKIPDPPAWSGGFWEHPLQIWDDQVGIGLRAQYVSSWYAAPIMLDTPTEDRIGLIVNISSSGAQRYAFSASYGVGKTGVDRLTHDMAVELAPHDISVVGLWPGTVRTEFILESASQGVAIDVDSAETPLYQGRIVAAVASDPRRRERSGQVFASGDLAEQYGVVDERGERPAVRNRPVPMPWARTEVET